jgi:hypothetical protein
MNEFFILVNKNIKYCIIFKKLYQVVFSTLNQQKHRAIQFESRREPISKRLIKFSGRT